MSGSTPTGPSPDGHADDLVSALLDGELDAGTATWVEAHLAECGPCRDAAAQARDARAWLRDLPAEDGSAAVHRVLARHRAVIRTGAAFVATAAVVIAALGLTSAVVHPEVVPAVEQLIAAHERAIDADAAAAGVTGAVLPSTDGEMVGMRRVEDVGRPYSAPTALLDRSSRRGQARLVRHAVFDGRDLTLVLYRSGWAEVSVFEQPGRLQWDQLGSGRLEMVGTRQVWLREGTPVVAVTEVGHVVVTIVSEDHEAVRMVAGELPEEHRGSTLDRLHDACVRFTRAFAAGG